MIKVGREAESLVASDFERRGFSITGRNLRFGPHEIDIVAERGDLVVMCEVRYRSDPTWIHPAETITRKKLGFLRTAAKRWLITHGAGRSLRVRFDLAVLSELRTSAIVYYENVGW